MVAKRQVKSKHGDTRIHRRGFYEYQVTAEICCKPPRRGGKKTCNLTTRSVITQRKGEEGVRDAERAVREDFQAFMGNRKTCKLRILNMPGTPANANLTTRRTSAKAITPAEMRARKGFLIAGTTPKRRKR